jgi:hypothetical protein
MRPNLSLFVLLGLCISLVGQTVWDKSPGLVPSPVESGSWDAHNDCGQSVSTGIYLVQLSTGTTQRAIKVIYLE